MENLLNLKELFKNAVSKFQDKVAIQNKVDQNWQDITYGQLEQKVKSVAFWLKKQDIQKSDRIALILENSPNWPTIYFAIFYVGAICVPVNPQSSLEEITNILKDAECKLVFISSALDISSFDLQAAKKIVKVGGDFENIFKIEQNLDESTLPSIELDDIATILYTSGTTDEPKGVVLTHRNLSSNINSLLKLKLMSEKDSVLSILPLYHTYSLTVTMLVPLFSGAKIAYTDSLRPEVLLESMQYTNTTILVGVPELFYKFHNAIFKQINAKPLLIRPFIKLIIEIFWLVRKFFKINVAKFLFHSLHKRFGRRMRFFACGGAKLDKRIERNLFKLGFTILEGYGLTETSPVLTFNPLKKQKIGSVGLPIPDVEIRIDKPDQNGIGEVIAKGENIMKGYYKKDAQTKECIKDGWFHTGDLGYFDKDGYLFLTGRQKEVIVLSSGKNIYPEEIESYYSKTPFVKELCVLSVFLDEATESLYAVVVPNLEQFKKWGEVNLRLVIKGQFENLSKELPGYKRIMGFLITHQPLPRTILGKLQRYKMEQIYLPQIKRQKQERKETPTSAEEQQILSLDIAQEVLGYLKKFAKRTVSLDDGLEIDLGIDSLGRIELACGLEETLRVKIPDELIGKVFTVRDLVLELNSIVKTTPQEEFFVKETVAWKEILTELPPKQMLKKIELNPGFIDGIITFFQTGFLHLFFKIFYMLKIENRQNLPHNGPYLVCVNHTSYFDGFIVAASCPNYVKLNLFFMGFRAYFEVPVIRRLIKTMRIVPIDLASHLLEAMRSAAYVLRNKKILCIFPEGERSIDGIPKEFKKGIGILVKELNLPVVPAFIKGAFSAWPRTILFPRMFKPIRIRFGNVIEPEDLEKEGGQLGAKDSYEAVSCAIRQRIINLMKIDEENVH